jgi:hypothetical protein
MSLRGIRNLLHRLAGEDDRCCPECRVVTFGWADDPPPPPVCPGCGRGPGDYPVGMVRAFLVHRPDDPDGQGADMPALPPPQEPEEAGSQGPFSVGAEASSA